MDFFFPSYRKGICPKGDDPMTIGQAHRQFSITTGGDVGTTLGGHFKFTFLGETIRFSADKLQWTDVECEADFEALDNINDVDCAQTDLDPGAKYTVTLKSFPTIPHENNIFYHDGNPTLDQMSCDISEVTSGSNPSVSSMVTLVRYLRIGITPAIRFALLEENVEYAFFCESSIAFCTRLLTRLFTMSLLCMVTD